MAKKTSSKHTHTHVPTHIGLTIIAVVALVFSALLITQYDSNNQTQIAQTHASYCPSKRPACGSINILVCTGSYWRCVPKSNPTTQPIKHPTPTPAKK